MRYVIALLVGIGIFAPKQAVSQNLIKNKDQIRDVTVHTHRDPITDQEITVVTIEGRHLILGWGCENDTLALMVAVRSGILTMGNPAEVTMRYDEHPAEDAGQWSVPESFKVAVSPDTLIHPLTERAMKARQLVMRTRDPVTNRIRTEVFGLMGLTRALGMLSCYKP